MGWRFIKLLNIFRWRSCKNFLKGLVKAQKQLQLHYDVYPIMHSGAAARRQFMTTQWLPHPPATYKDAAAAAAYAAGLCMRLPLKTWR